MSNIFSRGWLVLWGSLILFFGLQTTALAQTTQPEIGQCILAGRISGFGKWGPRLVHIELVDDKGQQVFDESSEALATVKQVRVNAPTLLVTCHRDKPGAKSESGALVPAVSAGSEPLSVKTLSMVPVGIGGHWVELEISAPQDRVVRVPAPTN